MFRHFTAVSLAPHQRPAGSSRRTGGTGEEKEEEKEEEEEEEEKVPGWS